VAGVERDDDGGGSSPGAHRATVPVSG
jgi:hypothetical protein